MAKKQWSWRRVASYGVAGGVGLALIPFAVPITVLVYLVVWAYTWTHDQRARSNLLGILPLHPRRVYQCARALWSGMLDGLGGPTLAIIVSYLAGKLTRSSRTQDTAVRDIKYGPAAGHRLDLFVPLAQGDGGGQLLPVVVVFPGYRWSKTKRARMYRPMAQTLCAAGRFVVLPRVGGKDAQVDDALCDFHAAVQWVFANAVNFGADPRRVHLLGYGAGAHLCMLYSLVVPLKTWYAQADRMAQDAQLMSTRAADRRLRAWLGRIRRVARPVAGLVLVSGVFDLAAQRRYEASRCIENVSATARTFGALDLAAREDDAWSPAAIVRALRRRSAFIPAELFAQSVLLIHGQRDSTFVLAQSQRMFRELCDVDVPRVDMKIYANLRRVDPAIALLAPGSPLALSLLGDIGASLEKVREDEDGGRGRKQQQGRRDGEGDGQRESVRESSRAATETRHSPASSAASAETGDEGSGDYFAQRLAASLDAPRRRVAIHSK